MSRDDRRKDRGIPPSRPTHDQIKEFRNRLGLSTEEAAARVYTRTSTWESYELSPKEPGFRSIPVPTWELFNIVSKFWDGVTFNPNMDEYLIRRYKGFPEQE